MKHVVLTLFILLSVRIGLAQDVVAIEQVIDAPVGSLYIHAGWDVRLIYGETDAYRIAIVVPEHYAFVASEMQICSLAGDTLIILENTMLPKGTIVELEGKLCFREIVMHSGAKASADCLFVPENYASIYLNLRKKAEMNIHQFNSTGEPFIYLEESCMNIDSICGNGKPEIELFNGTFKYGVSLLDGEILVSEYRRPRRDFEKKGSKVIKTKMGNGKLVTTERNKIWDDEINVSIKIGFKKFQNPVEFSSPFTNNGVFSCSLETFKEFHFNSYFSLSVGLQLNFNRYYMAHQLKLNENGLENLDGQTPIQKNQLTNSYLGIPVAFYLGPSNSNLSLDVFLGRCISGSLETLSAADNYKKWQSEKATNLFIPWKIEVGLGVNTNIIGFIHGFRIYANLLPEFNKAFATERFRSIGIEVRL